MCSRAIVASIRNVCRDYCLYCRSIFLWLALKKELLRVRLLYNKSREIAGMLCSLHRCFKLKAAILGQMLGSVPFLVSLLM